MISPELLHLKSVRLAELEFVIQNFAEQFKRSNTILELGAGAGWQARRIELHGCNVQAIDTPSSNYDSDGEFHVIRYDGLHIPFPTSTFDLVYSSNVLEHIHDLAPLASELTRALKQSGLMLHIVPSASWRFWTLVAHPLYLVKRIFRRLRPRNTRQPPEHSHPSVESRTHAPRMLSILLPRRHGEHSNLIGEFYLFSHLGWSRRFKLHGWTILRHSPCPIFYTGCNIFGERLSITFRQILSKVLGNACHIYLLKPSCKECCPENRPAPPTTRT